MKIIITMAGEGRRFKEKGVEEEKWRLRIREKSMFEWALSSLEDFFDEEFVFITQKDHEARGFIERKCCSLGIERFDVIELDERTDGQATTALAAGRLIEDSDEIAVYNIDTYVEPRGIEKDKVAGDGHIPVFRAQGDNWSFVEKDDEDGVVDVAEKKPISELATVGFYYFRTFRDFREAYENLSEEVKEEHGEVYIAPLYRWLLEEGGEVTVQEIDNEQVHILGTPEEVQEFWPEFYRDRGIEP